MLTGAHRACIDPCAAQGGGAALAVGVLRREGIPQRLAEALCLEAGVPLDRCGARVGDVHGPRRAAWALQLSRGAGSGGRRGSCPGVGLQGALGPYDPHEGCPAQPARVVPTAACALLPPLAPGPRRKLSELKRGERAALVAALTQYRLHVTGHEVRAAAQQARHVRARRRTTGALQSIAQLAAFMSGGVVVP